MVVLLKNDDFSDFACYILQFLGGVDNYHIFIYTLASILVSQGFSVRSIPRIYG